MKANVTVKVRAKAVCQCGEPNADGSKSISLVGVYAHGPNGQAVEENRVFGEATPYFHLSMTIRNPVAAAQFETNKNYYVEFVRAED